MTKETQPSLRGTKQSPSTRPEMTAGAEALDGSLMFYNSMKTAARSNVADSQAIYDNLSKRFPGRKAEKPPMI